MIVVAVFFISFDTAFKGKKSSKMLSFKKSGTSTMITNDIIFSLQNNMQTFKNRNTSTYVSSKQDHSQDDQPCQTHFASSEKKEEEKKYLNGCLQGEQSKLTCPFPLCQTVIAAIYPLIKFSANPCFQILAFTFP